MVFQWQRIPPNETVETATADTTETQLGTGLSIPSWANSIKAIMYSLRYAVLTTDEYVSGYLRLKDDSNLIEPFYLPLPVASSLAAAAGTHQAQQISLPIELPLKPEDTLRAYVALDMATTGVHEIDCNVLLSSESPAYREHTVMTAATAGATTPVASAAVTLTTLAGKCTENIGWLGYVSDTLTAAQSPGGYFKISASIPGWIDQRLRTNDLPSGLGTDIDSITKPFMYGEPIRVAKSDGLLKGIWPGFPVHGRNDFSTIYYPADTNTDAGVTRLFLNFKE